MDYNNYYGNPYFQKPYYYGNNGASPDMLNQMKGQYQPQMVQQPSAPMPMVTSSLIYVDNEEQAKNYLVAPNNVVSMFDKNKPLLYVNGADGAGMPNFKKYVISEYEENGTPLNVPKTPEKHECQCGNKFILKEELNAVQGEIQEIMCRLSDIEDKYKTLSAKPTPKTTKTTKTEE